MTAPPPSRHPRCEARKGSSSFCRMWNADLMANLAGDGEVPVRFEHHCDSFPDAEREGGGFLRRHVNVDHDMLAHRGEPIVFGMMHLLHVVNALGVMVEQPECHFYTIAGMKLPKIGDMGFKREERAVGALHIVRPESEEQEGLIAGAIENHIVIGHVEVAVVIDPLVLHLMNGADEGGGEGHRNFPDSC